MIRPLLPAREDNMGRYVKKKKGFSLVEVMIALCVLLLVFMGLMQSALLGIDNNLRNIFRDEAIKIAAERMEETRSMPFAQIISDVNVDNLMLPACAPPPINDPGPYEVAVQRDFRNIQNFPYGTRMTVTPLDGPPADTLQIQLTIRWQYRNECFTHSIISLMRRP